MDPQIVDIDVWKVKGNFWLNWHDKNERDEKPFWANKGNIKPFEEQKHFWEWRKIFEWFERAQKRTSSYL